jgi:hypothetical protein
MLSAETICPKYSSLSQAKRALATLDEEMCLAEQGEDNTKVFDVFVHRGAVNQNIVHEDEYRAPQARLKYSVHDTLEHGRRVAEPEWHDTKLIVPLMFFEVSLVLIFRAHANLVIPGAQIQFGEEFGAGEFIQ